MSSQQQIAPLTLQASTNDNLLALAGLAEFWRIPYTTGPSSISSQIVMTSGSIPEPTNGGATTIISPAGLENARRISERLNLGLDVRTLPLHLPFSRTATTSIVTATYVFKSPQLETIIDSEGTPVLSRLGASNVYLLSIDLVSELGVRFSQGLEDPPSMKFRMATHLPFSYRMIPSSIRNRAFRRYEQREIGKEKLAPIECLRTAFLASIISASGTPMPFIGFWREGRKFAVAVTHDVETHEGLVRGAKELLRVEQELGIRSTWNIVTNRYQLTRERLKPLVQSGEIGAHDTNHDGRLIFLSPNDRTKRLRACRETLERLTESTVRGFRAPLLQHDRQLLGAVGKAGFVFDSSVPCWELLSPTSLKSHGVGTVFPFEIEGVVEAPVSLPQDHQLLRVQGLTPSEAVEALTQESRWLSEIGALSVLLIHPDYDFGTETHGEDYSRLLRIFSRDPACDLNTLGEATDWWSRRAKAKLEISEDGLTVSSSGTEPSREFQVQLAKGYDQNGFAISKFN